MYMILDDEVKAVSAAALRRSPENSGFFLLGIKDCGAGRTQGGFARSIAFIGVSEGSDVPRVAPWTVVETNCTWYARITVLKTVIEEIHLKLRRRIGRME